MQLDKQFHKIKKSTREHLEKQNIPVKEVTDALTSLVTYEGEIHHKLFLRDNVKDLLGADDHSEVFVLMNFHWDYLNYHLLEVVIKRFDIAKIKEEMNSYKLNLQHFREKTTLTLFCNAHKRKPRKPQGFCELVAEFNWPNNEDVTLEVVEDFRKKYMDQYHLQDFAMMLDEVRPGSFIVTWLVPESIVEMLKFTPKVPTELLQEYYVTELQVTGITVFQVIILSILVIANNNPVTLWFRYLCPLVVDIPLGTLRLVMLHQKGNSLVEYDYNSILFSEVDRMFSRKDLVLALTISYLESVKTANVV